MHENALGSLMRSMRALTIFALLVAAIAAAEPLVDRCPFGSGEENVCVWCAAAIAPVGVHRPVVTPTLVLAYQLVAICINGHSFDAPLPLPSRAPPTW